MADSKHVEASLEKWGEDLFFGRARKRGGKGDAPLKHLRFTRPGAANGKRPATAQDVRARLNATVKKTSEVMVKITGGGKCMRDIKNHFDYITRNGKEALEDQDGNVTRGVEGIKDARDQWRDGRHPIPDGEGTRKEAFNIMFSMPPGTPRKEVTDAVRDFARETFGGKHDYVFATHTDEPHPHVHLVVKATGYDGKRLNPRKADLQDWREFFAEKLREHGIEANATRRQARGVTKKPLKQKVYHAQKKGTAERYFPDKRPVDPFAEKSAETHRAVLGNYKELATALARSADPVDRRIAVGITQLVAGMPAAQKSLGRSKEAGKTDVREVEKGKGSAVER